ncbi:MAG: hypothetical protein ACLU62_06170 [Hydrogeniiclostridium sp.]
MEKKIYFNRIVVDPSFKITKTNPEERLTEAFNSIFPQAGINYSGNKNEMCFYIHSKDASHIFATYSKRSDPNPFARIRNIESQQIEEISAAKNEIFEYFTFFYIDFPSGYMATITNQHTLRLEKDLEEFARTVDIHLGILPFFDEEAASIIKKFKSIQSIIYTVSNTSTINEFHTLSENLKLMQGVPIKSLQITVKLNSKQSKGMPVETLIKDLDFKGYASVKVNGEPIQAEDNFSQCYDLIKKSFSRSVKIHLPNTKELDEIEKIMRSELHKSIDDHKI